MSANGEEFRPRAPRVAPLEVAELDADQQRLAGSIDDQFTQLPNVVLTLLRHPALYEAWLPMASRLLLESSFTPRERELVILRTAVVIGSAYEWGQHVALSREILDDDELADIVHGPTARWSTREVALLRAVDELHARAGISDATWSLLAAEFDVRQLVELPMLVGQYHMIAFTVHALGVQPEAGSVPLPTP